MNIVSIPVKFTVLLVSVVLYNNGCHGHVCAYHIV